MAQGDLLSSPQMTIDVEHKHIMPQGHMAQARIDIKNSQEI